MEVGIFLTTKAPRHKVEEQGGDGSIIKCAIILIVWHNSGGQRGQNLSKRVLFESKRPKSAVERPKSDILLPLSGSDKP